MDQDHNSLLNKLTGAPHLLLVLLLLLTALSYSNTLNSPLVLDDRNSFIESNLVYLKDFSPTSFANLLKTRFGLGRFVPILTFAINHKLAQGQAIYYHLTNIGIHLLNCLVLFLFIGRILKLPGAVNDLKILSPGIFAIAICGLWTLSPVQTNAVTYLVQRMTSLATLFYLLTLIFYLLGRQTNRLIKALIYYSLSAISLVLAAMSKENTATLPLAALMLEEFFIKPGCISQTLKRIRWRTWLSILVAAIILLPLFETPWRDYVLWGYRAREFTLAERLLTESRIVVWYISLLLLPLPSRMNLDHDFSRSTSLLAPPTTILSIVLIGSLLILAWKSRNKQTLLSFGIFWFFLNLAIESTVIPLELIFEHRLYLPSIGLFIALMAIADQFLWGWVNKRHPALAVNKICFLIVVILFAASSLLTTLRNNDWRDELSINQDCAEKSPHKSRALTNYGLALASLKRYDEAIPLFNKAIAIGRPFEETYITAANNIVLSLTMQGKYDEALKEGGRLFRNIENQTNVLDLSGFMHNLAYVYLMTKKYPLAIEAIKSSLTIRDQNTNRETISLATSILSQAYESPESRKEIGFADKVGKTEAILLKLAEILLDTRNYTDADEVLGILTAGFPEDPAVKVLDLRLHDELTKNQNAEEASRISNHPPYKTDMRYRLGMKAVSFISKNYSPLRPIIGKILDWTTQGDKYANDPFVALYYLDWQQTSPDTALDINKLQLAIKNNPDFVPLLSKSLPLYRAAGLNKEALATGTHLLEIYPGYSDWNMVSKFISKLQKQLGSVGDASELRPS